MLDRWPPTDVVELFVALPLKRASKLFEWRARETVKAVALLSPEFRAALLKDVSIARIVKVLDKMEPEQALQDLDDLPEDGVCPGSARARPSKRCGPTARTPPAAS